MIFIIFIIILVIILGIILILQNEYYNNFFTNLIDPINYINYNKFKNIYNQTNKNIPIYIFFHFCPKSTNNIDHINIINEQINNLVISGLYDYSTKILYGCNCKDCDIFLDNYLQKYSKFKKLNNAICPNKKSYENITINSMLEFSKKNKKEFYGLYLHTKGTSSGNNKAVSNWRNFMMFYLVNNYKLCIDILNRGFYTCGVNYLNYPKHYSGNFFWFNSNYLRTLNYIIKVEDRINAEYWLFSNYIKNKHISICKKRFKSSSNNINLGIIHFYIKTGLYYFKFNYDNIKDTENIQISVI
jgi:hypothetical protein